MPSVTLLPAGNKIEVPSGTLLFDAACRAGLPVSSSCSAAEVCGRCVMRIVEGIENLSPVSAHEQTLLNRDKRQATERVSCMTRVLGECSVTTGYW